MRTKKNPFVEGYVIGVSQGASVAVIAAAGLLKDPGTVDACKRT
jgi:hypothetical protein